MAVANARLCLPLRNCHDKRRSFDGIMITGQLAVLEGKTAIALGEAATRLQLPEVIAKVLKVIADGKRLVAAAQGVKGGAK